MIQDDLSRILSGIQKAKDIQRSILFFSEEPNTVDKAGKLWDVITQMQNRIVSIQSEYFKLLQEKRDLERKLIESDPSIKIVE